MPDILGPGILVDLGWIRRTGALFGQQASEMDHHQRTFVASATLASGVFGVLPQSSGASARYSRAHADMSKNLADIARILNETADGLATTARDYQGADASGAPGAS
jgi:hypothetical protein